MRLLVTLLLALMMTAHAGLGCCWHHEHHTEAIVQVVCCHHDHEHGDSHSTPTDHETPTSCDEDPCVYVVHESSAVSWDFLSALSAMVVSELPCPAGDLLRAHSHAALDDVSYPSGPRLHLWQCVLVI
jgi:hypothetical protein